MIAVIANTKKDFHMHMKSLGITHPSELAKIYVFANRPQMLFGFHVTGILDITHNTGSQAQMEVLKQTHQEAIRRMVNFFNKRKVNSMKRDKLKQLSRLRRKLERLEQKEIELRERYVGNEQKYTFHGGFDYGYTKGQMSILEDQIGDLQMEIDSERGMESLIQARS